MLVWWHASVSFNLPLLCTTTQNVQGVSTSVFISATDCIAPCTHTEKKSLFGCSFKLVKLARIASECSRSVNHEQFATPCTIVHQRVSNIFSFVINIYCIVWKLEVKCAVLYTDSSAQYLLYNCAIYSKHFWLAIYQLQTHASVNAFGCRSPLVIFNFCQLW